MRPYTDEAVIILDSSFIVSYEIEDDINHKRAKEVLKEIETGRFGKAVTTDYIFDETVTVTFIRSKSLRKAIEAGVEIKGSMEVLKVDDLAIESAWQVFKTQKKTKFSFTDCTILSMMQIHDIANVAAFDADFGKIRGINVIK